MPPADGGVCLILTDSTANFLGGCRIVPAWAVLGADDGWHCRRRNFHLNDADGLDPRVVEAIVDNEIRRAVWLLDTLAPWQNPEAVARWRPRLLAALGDVKARNRINSRAHRARQRRKRIASDKRSCSLCAGQMAGRRIDAQFCSNARRQKNARQIAKTGA
jgi:hypothetical protein